MITRMTESSGPTVERTGAGERDRTADLITNQPVLAVFSFENEPLGGLWEVIFGPPRVGVPASRIDIDTYSTPSRRESITSQSAMQACTISLLSRNCPWIPWLSRVARSAACTNIWILEFSNGR